MKAWPAAVALIAASPGVAAARDYCPTRPSLGQSACVLDPGRVAIETGLVDWERDAGRDRRTDTVLFADSLFRIGLTDRVEVQIGFTPVGTERMVDRSTGERTRRSGVGDVSVGTRIALRNPDGSGFSFGLQPSVILPAGRRPIGDGTWSASVIVPVTYDLNDRVNLQLSSEVAAAANEDNRGRHLRYGTTAGVELALAEPLSLTVEGQWYRDDDAADPASEVRGAAALAYMANDDLSLDVGGVAGLNHSTPDVRVYAGISRRF